MRGETIVDQAAFIQQLLRANAPICGEICGEICGGTFYILRSMMPTPTQMMVSTAKMVP